MKKNENSSLKRVFMEVYLKQGAQKRHEYQSIKIIFGEKPSYIQKGHAYAELEMRVRKAVKTNFIVNTEITNGIFSSANNAIVFTIFDARNSTSSGTETEQKIN